MKTYITKIHYSKDLSVFQTILKLFFAFLSLFYLLGINIRNFLYEKKFLKSRKLEAYVISIGNLTTGGTGKTPLTIKIARFLAKQPGNRVAVLSHGYGGKLSTKTTNIISDGKNIFYTPHLAGDEPYLIAENTRDVTVVTGRNRYNSGREAIEKFSSNILILDDGYQHIKLQRDLNILVVDCNKRFGNNLVLPAGPLREPVSQIKRADRIIVVNKNPFDKVSEENCRNYVEFLKNKYNKPVFQSNFVNIGIYNLKDKSLLESGSSVYAFAGIAQPDSFFNELTRSGYQAIKTREYTDHHLYTTDDINYIIKEARLVGAHAIVTTEKDAVKISALLNDSYDIPIYALKLGLDLDLDRVFEDTAVLKQYGKDSCS